MQLVDIQKQPSKSYGKRSIAFFIEGSGEEVSASMEFEVAEVAYQVLSLGRLVAKGYASSIGEHESYMAKG